MISSPTLTLDVNIRSMKKTFFLGKSASVTSINDKGVFDILPMHINFICLIRNYIILGKGTKEEKKLIITTGILRVSANKVDIFLNV